MEQVKKKIIEYVHSLGITEAGVAGDGSTYSAVVCLFPYFSGYKDGANLSLYTQPEDYHLIVAGFLSKISDYIKTLIPNVTAASYADNHGGDDRAMAYTAGLGIYGRNGLIINKKYGSYVFIGYVKIDVPLPPDGPARGECLMCGKCEKMCPGGALDGGFTAEKCASHISQTKGELSPRQVEILQHSGLIFGCDICQRVCPMNENISHTNLPEFLANIKPMLSADEISGLSERGFKQKFGNRAFSWRGRKILERNLAVLGGIKINDTDKI